MKYTPDVLARFWAKVDKSGECWEWTASKTYGYGRLKAYGRMKLAHRMSWEIANDGRDIPAELEVDHTCFNHGCVNPDHLRLLTRSENAAIHPPWKKPNALIDICPKGHDKRVTGRAKRGSCLVCQRAATRDYMRRMRAAKAA